MIAKKILVPIDFSTCGNAALGLAASLARDSGAMLLLLHVDGTPLLTAGGEYLDSAPGLFKDVIRKRLNEVALPDPNLRCERRVETGNPSEEIVRLAKEEQVDFIVMGTHGRRGLTRLLLGSIAEGVMRRAPCPVLTIHAVAMGQPVVEESVAMARPRSYPECDNSASDEDAPIMNIDDDKRAYMVLPRSEHRNINEILLHVSTVVRPLGDPSTNDSKLAEAIEHLAHLRQELKQHFLVEESGGCLDEAVARYPSIGQEVDTINAEHPRLMEQLDALIHQATRIAEGGSEQADFSRQWERFVAELSNHEDAEDRLLLRGLESVATEV